MTEVEKLMAMIAQQRDEAYVRGREDALTSIRRAVEGRENAIMTIVDETPPPMPPPPVKRGRRRPDPISTWR